MLWRFMNPQQEVEKAGVAAPEAAAFKSGHVQDEGDKALKPFTHYANHLRNQLPQDVFKPNPWRMGWFFSYSALAVACFCAIGFLDPAWPIKALLGAVAGFCFGSLGFFAHEVLHGTVIRNRFAQDAISFFGFAPFFISPTFWRYWHNQLHHGKTQSTLQDPDAYPNMRVFKSSKFMQFMFPFTPGSGHKRSYTYFLFWFSFHVFVAQTYLRFRNSLFDRLNHRRVTIEFTAQVLLVLTVLFLTGPSNLLWTFVIPLFVQNYYVMGYIATNHNLSPLTRVNDPLVNSLTVTNHPLLEMLQLNFGYHVEHHIFPSVSPKHAKKIHELLKKEYPTQFQVMSKYEAMKALYQTARIYKDSKTLMNPETGKTYPTLGS